MDFLKKKIFFLELVILYTRILFWLFFHGSVKEIRQEKKKKKRQDQGRPRDRRPRVYVSLADLRQFDDHSIL